MSFWDLRHRDADVALVDSATGREWTFAELRRDVEDFQCCIPRTKSLGLLYAENRPECIIAYLGALRSRNAVILVDGALSPEFQLSYLTKYRPDWVFSITAEAIGDYECCSYKGLWYAKTATRGFEIHQLLAVLLATSGSTGDPKLVRLTADNLQANAESIASYLELTSEARPITSLPMAYSFGLSVINSHLQAGSCVVLTRSGVLQKRFWDAVNRYACTSLAGVPYTYEMLLRLGILKTNGASLRTFTQAGGRLDISYQKQVYELASQRGVKFFVMYGQTEATARISYVPPTVLGRKMGSIGIPIPRGALRIDPENEELIYAGPNVMMGYAEGPHDLTRGDELGGILRTGDLARVDDEGYFYITGRMKRFLKIFGKRFNLDDIEIMLRHHCALPIACFGKDDMLTVAVEAAGAELSSIDSRISSTYSLHHSAFRVIDVPVIPRNANGKTDYTALSESVLSSEYILKS